ncbi:MAG: D-glucuronyl C5-epimerase family protein [Gammaproteobacteria bacterium]|nr:D-glucuronyl C5-epimerase family protein [Gammaproteobacteria bacterium]
MIISKAYRVIYNNFIAVILKKTTTATFWYIPDTPNLINKERLSDYLTMKPSPIYPINYQGKLKYNLKHPESGIIALQYDQPIGQQINPEAAFQYALGLHDRYVHQKSDADLKDFLHYADYFLAQQSSDGDWYYQFDWYISKAPWTSALAQSRGASVMLRAWFLTKNEAYLRSAKLALSKFMLDISKGGYLHRFDEANCDYFEEYPKAPSGVINGFMASIFALWELTIWTQDSDIQQMFDMSILSLEKMLPYYTLNWWTLYDRRKKYCLLNINSPYYHKLQLNYMVCLALISNSEVLKMYAHKWHKDLTPFNKFKSVMNKFLFKVLEY